MDAPHAPVHAGAVHNRSNLVREGRLNDVEADRLVTGSSQRSHECLAEMPCTPRDEDDHTVPPPSWRTLDAPSACRTRRNAMVSDQLTAGTRLRLPARQCNL